MLPEALSDSTVVGDSECEGRLSDATEATDEYSRLCVLDEELRGVFD